MDLPKVLLSLGAVLLILALLHGALVLGVPYPDPTPEQQAHWRRQDQINNWLWIAGLLLLALWVLITLARRLCR